MKTKLSISIDDITPHPKSSIKVIERCNDLIDKFSDIKFTLFVPMAYWRTVSSPSESMCKSPLKISEFPDFCSAIRNLPSRNFEIGIHGYYHGIPGISNNDEFKSIDYKCAESKFHQIFNEIHSAKLDKHVKSIFRPPAWRMSPDAIRAAHSCGIELLALSPKDYALQSYCNAHIEAGRFTFYDANPPFDNLCENLSNFKKYEVVYHACEWDKNYLSVDFTKQIENWIHQRTDQLEFSFLSETET